MNRFGSIFVVWLCLFAVTFAGERDACPAVTPHTSGRHADRNPVVQSASQSSDHGFAHGIRYSQLGPLRSDSVHGLSRMGASHGPLSYPCSSVRSVVSQIRRVAGRFPDARGGFRITRVSISSGLGSCVLESCVLSRGIGGLLYTVEAGAATHNLYNSRGDVICQTSAAGAVTYGAQYEAFGTRKAETNTAKGRQRANTKDEDPTGLLNEGFRYRDLEAGVFLTRDPAGFVDGPNVYTYVRQNPWTMFDPDGLRHEVLVGGSRTKPESKEYGHDKRPGNYTRSSYRHVKRLVEKGEKVNVYINRIATEKRGEQDGEDYLKEIKNAYRNLNTKYGRDMVNLHLYTSAKDLKRQMQKNVAAEKADSFRYFGHQAPGSMWLGFGTADDSVSLPLPHDQYTYDERSPMVQFTPNNLRESIPSNRVKNHFEFRDYGCNSKDFAQEMSKHFSKPAMGSDGSTTYSPVYLNGSPSPTSDLGYWHYDSSGKVVTKDKANEFPSDNNKFERGHTPLPK